MAPGVTPVGSGPFQVRPRLRGLDSTRVLVLVDGERLNNARTATDRAGVEVGLVDPTPFRQIEVLGGAGSVLYGTDALVGHDQHHHQPAAASRTSAAHGRLRRVLQLERERPARQPSPSASRTAAGPCRFIGGAEHFDDYSAGGDFDESSTPFLTTTARIAQTRHVDTHFRLQLQAVSRIRSTRLSRGRAPSSRIRAMKGRRQPRRDGCSSRRTQTLDVQVPAPSRGRRRLPGLRAAVLLPGDHAAVEPPGQGVGDLRVHQPHAVAVEARGHARTSSARIDCCAIEFPVQFPGAVADRSCRSASTGSTSRATRGSRFGRPASTCRRRFLTRPTTCSPSA